MSGYAYKCDVFGPNFADSDAPVRCTCGVTHQPYPCGVTPDRDGPAIIVSDEIHGEAQMDWAAGRRFASKSERKLYYAAMGLRRASVREAQNAGVMADHPSVTKDYYIPGVKPRPRGLRWHEQVR